jgi:hypothetical protein
MTDPGRTVILRSGDLLRDLEHSFCLVQGVYAREAFCPLNAFVFSAYTHPVAISNYRSSHRPQ